MPEQSPFVHRFESAGVEGLPPLLLLHGTGGCEHDLVPLGQAIAPGAALLAPRGRVLENGMARYFRRFAEGVFDYADVRRRTEELAVFVEDACRTHGLDAPVAVGYSNGANIAAALLYLEPRLLAGAVLLRAMVPLDTPPVAAANPVLILSGAHDRMIPPDESVALEAALQAAGTEVTHRVQPAGHGLVEADTTAAREWFEARFRQGDH